MLPESSAFTSWHNHHFVWKHPDTWVPHLEQWLSPKFRKDVKRRLRPGVCRDLYIDDPEWIDILSNSLIGDFEDHVFDLATDLGGTTLRTYHGCRTEDATSYFRDGLRLHGQNVMLTRLHMIIEEHSELHWIKPQLDKIIGNVDNVTDEGHLYVVLDDGFLLKYAAHY